MAKTSTYLLASRETLCTAMKWDGENYNSIRYWARHMVNLNADGELTLDTGDGKEVVPVGNYILCVGNWFHNLSPDELHESYVRVYAED